jgi:hypothetical protein
MSMKERPHIHETLLTDAMIQPRNFCHKRRRRKESKMQLQGVCSDPERYVPPSSKNKRGGNPGSGLWCALAALKEAK